MLELPDGGREMVDDAHPGRELDRMVRKVRGAGFCAHVCAPVRVIVYLLMSGACAPWLGAGKPGQGGEGHLGLRACRPGIPGVAAWASPGAETRGVRVGWGEDGGGGADGAVWGVAVQLLGADAGWGLPTGE